VNQALSTGYKIRESIAEAECGSEKIAANKDNSPLNEVGAGPSNLYCAHCAPANFHKENT